MAESGAPMMGIMDPAPHKGGSGSGSYDAESRSGDDGPYSVKGVQAVYEHDEELTPREKRILKLKCGLFMGLLPGISYSLQYLDKACVASASVMGIRKDLHMHGNQYSWTTSSYFIGYLVCNIPFALLLLEKAGPKWNGAALLAWGTIVACSAGAQSYAGFIACRVLLGVLESVCEPSITIMTHQWTPPEEHYAWIETWFAWNGYTAIFLNAISYALYWGQIHHQYSIPGWRILLLICGLMSVVGAVVYILLVPNSPQEAVWLSDKEKRAMARANVGEKHKFHRQSIEWHQIWEAMTVDLHKTVLLFLSIFCNSLNGGAVNTFISLIIKNFIVQGNRKLTDVQANERSLLYGMIPGGIKAGGCTIIVVLALTGFMKNFRFFYILMFSALHVAAAFMLTYGSHDKKDNHSGGANVALAGTYIYNFSVEVAHGGIISLMATNTQGYTKKIFVNGLTLLGFGVGNVVGPQIFKASQLKDNWPTGRRALAALSVVSFACLVGLLISYVVENRQKDKKDEKLPEGANPALLTDKENPEFRYQI